MMLPTNIVPQQGKVKRYSSDNIHIDLELVDLADGVKSPKGRSTSFLTIERTSSKKSYNLKSHSKDQLASYDAERDSVSEEDARSSHHSAYSNSVVEMEEDGQEQLLDNGDSAYPDGGLKAYLVVFGAFLGLIIDFGLMNSVAAIQVYVQAHQLQDVSVATTGWIFSIYTFLTFGGGLVAGPLFDQFGARAIGIPGSIMMVVGIFTTGSCTSIYQFILAFGVCSGLGTSLLMTPLVGVISHFFLKKRAMAMGLAMMGGSLGGVILPLILRELYPKVGFGWALRIIGFIFIGLLVPCLFLIDDRHKELNKDQDNTRSLYMKVKDGLDFSGLKEKPYALLVIALVMNEFSLILCFTYISSYALSRGYSDSTALIVLTVCNAAGIPGRYIPSHLSDYFGRFNVICFCSLMMTVSLFVVWYPFGSYIGGMYTFAVIYGFFSAATLSLTPSCTGQISKTRDFGKRYGTAYFFAAFGNLICIPIGGAIINKSTKKEFDNMVLFAACTCVCATFFFVASRYSLAGFKRAVV